MNIRTFKAGLAAIALGSIVLATPAFAGGSFSLNYAPTDAEDAQALGLGLSVLSIVNGMSGKGGNIGQNGFGNAAGIAQNGLGNHGVILQEGNGHEGTIEQNGDNNSCGLFQLGQNTDAECVQNGDGQSSATVVFGW
jgi:hypothetical protein